MRSLHHLLRHIRRDSTNESIKYAYRWLFARAHYLQKHSPSKSLFGIFRSLIEQYHRHVPIEYLCGSAMFCNRLFIVNRHVLIPRRDSEVLIDHIQELYRENTQKQSMLEIGTGSGCLSITLAHHFPQWNIHACDISSSALRVARQNAHRHHCRNIHFHHGDLFDVHFLQHSSFDVILSNPPYISQTEISQCDRGIFHEPSIALFAQPPLKFYLTIIERASQGWLNDNGYLIFECSPFNIDQIRQYILAKSDHFNELKIRFDRNELPRVISAKKKPSIRS